jgi:hypothetical protein
MSKDVRKQDRNPKGKKKVPRHGPSVQDPKRNRRINPKNIFFARRQTHNTKQSANPWNLSGKQAKTDMRKQSFWLESHRGVEQLTR